MPGIFGFFGTYKTFVEYFHDYFIRTFGTCELQRFDEGCIGGHAHQEAGALKIDLDGNFFVVDGEQSIYKDIFSDSKYGSSLFKIKDDNIELARECKGNVAVYDSGSNRVLLASDWTGCFPLYYCKHNDGFVFSSHLTPLANLLNAKMDLVGLAERISLGWLLHKRTYYAGIFRLLPGESIIYSIRTKKLVVKNNSRFWSQCSKDILGPKLIESSMEVFEKSCQLSFDPTLNNGLMLSGGWDSRLLLAGMNNVTSKEKISTLAFGRLNSREVKIAKNISEYLNLQHYELPSNPKSLGNPDELRDMFHRVETVMFPYWDHTASYLAKHKVQCVAFGILGEVLGGHYCILPSMSKLNKITHFISTYLKNPAAILVTEQVCDQFWRLIDSMITEHALWYLDENIILELPKIKEAIKEDVYAELQRYAEQGITSYQSLMEAYVTQHRGCQFAAMQPRISRGRIDVTLPFADRDLLMLASSIDPSYRLHNQLFKKLLKKIFPEMLAFPIASTLLPASYPILFQEFGRLVRASVVDAAYKKIYVKSRGKLGRIQPCGWLSFEEHFSNGKVFEEMNEAIEWDLISKPAVARYIDKVKHLENRVYQAYTMMEIFELNLIYSDKGP